MIIGLLVGFLAWAAYLVMVIVSLKPWERLLPGFIMVAFVFMMGIGGAVGFMIQMFKG